MKDIVALALFASGALFGWAVSGLVKTWREIEKVRRELRRLSRL